MQNLGTGPQGLGKPAHGRQPDYDPMIKARNILSANNTHDLIIISYDCKGPDVRLRLLIQSLSENCCLLANCMLSLAASIG